MWGATLTARRWPTDGKISIHAPRVGRDCCARMVAAAHSDFNPRAPCGARQFDEEIAATGIPFQSTRPVWGATAVPAWWQLHTAISIHAPRAGCDAGRRGHLTSRASISIHAPRVGRDYVCTSTIRRDWISIHAPRVGRDSKFDDFTPSNLHKRYKRVLARPKNTREKGKIKQKLAYIHAFSAFLGCEGSGTFCALVLRTQYR